MASNNEISSGAPVLPNPTRIITTTDHKHAIASFDRTHDESIARSKNLGDTVFRLAYVSKPPPIHQQGADLTYYAQQTQSLPQLTLPGGATVVWYIDTPPGSTSPLHRTLSLDYVVLVAGSLRLTLDSGETRDVKQGDLVVQRGTMHQWTNTSETQWARMVAVMTSSEPVVLDDGTELGLEFREH